MVEIGDVVTTKLPSKQGRYRIKRIRLWPGKPGGGVVEMVREDPREYDGQHSVYVDEVTVSPAAGAKRRQTSTTRRGGRTTRLG